MLAQLLTIIIIVSIYVLTKNIWISILLSIALFLIERNLRPFYMAAWYKKFPPQEFLVVKEENMEDGFSRGMRGLIISQLCRLDVNEEGHRQILEELLEQAVSQLSEEYPIFKLRYDTVERKGLPIQVSCASCGESGHSLRKCYIKWINSEEIKPFNGEPGKERFIHDCIFNDPDSGETRAAAVIIAFDKRLPSETDGQDRSG